MALFQAKLFRNLGNVVELFKAAIKSPVTRDVYERRLLDFLDHMKMTPEEFLLMTKESTSNSEMKIIAFAFKLKGRHEKGEIAA
jgi:hypothetical protein